MALESRIEAAVATAIAQGQGVGLGADADVVEPSRLASALHYAVTP